MVGGGDKGDLVLYHSPFYTQTHYTNITHWLVVVVALLVRIGINHEHDVQQNCHGGQQGCGQSLSLLSCNWAARNIDLKFAEEFFVATFCVQISGGVEGRE